MARSCTNHPDPNRDLVALAQRLDAVAEDVGWGAPPLLVGLTAHGVDGLDPPVSLPRAPGMPCDDVVAALVGFEAPEDWEALAVVVQGRAWELGDGPTGPRPVRLTHVVDRTGGSASVVRRAGEEPEPGGPDGAGRLPDVCRRALGLATDPPPADSTELWAVQWLDNVITRAARGERLRGLVVAALAHPAIELVADHEPRLVDEAVARLVRLGSLMGRQRPWDRLRRAAIAGEWPVDDLTPEGAAWMDDGMFARWVLAGFPSVADYLTELVALVPEATLEGIRGVLAEWDLV